jgi:hypothetical protein
MNNLKKFRLATTSAILAIGCASPVLANDIILWTWNQNISTDFVVTSTVDISTANPTIAEFEQTFVGSTSATSIGLVTVPSLGLDPVGTPAVIAEATAVNNNLSINTDQALFTDSTQLTYGGLAVGASLDLLDFTSLSLDLVTASSVDAIASATGTDMDVISSATGVANNLSIDAANMSINNGQQFAVANVTATATSTGAALLSTSPNVTASATAVGNNVSVTVNTPSI